MKVEWKTCLRVGISVFLLYLAIYYWQGVSSGIALFLGAASPLLLGCVIAYLINIPMSFYERHFFPKSNSPLVKKTRRTVCMLAAILTLIGIVAAVIGLVIPELFACIRELFDLLLKWIPEAVAWVTDFVEDSESLDGVVPQEFLDNLENINWQEWGTKIIQFLTSGIGGAVGTAVGAITSVMSSVVSFVFGLIFALYILFGKEKLADQCKRLMKSYLPTAFRERITHVFGVINDCFHRYVVGQCTEAVILGTLCIIGMWICRFPYATMIGTLVGFTALIPIAGAYIGTVVGAFMILTVSPIKAVLFLIFLLVLQQIEGNLIYPKVVGTSIGLPGMWVLAAVTVGGSIAGIPGMLIGVPLMAAIYRLVREDVRRREGKERAAVSRRYRENREKKYVKAAKNTPKLKDSEKITAQSGQQIKENAEKIKNSGQKKVKKDAAKQSAEKQNAGKRNTEKQNAEKQNTEKQNTEKQNSEKQNSGKQNTGKPNGQAKSEKKAAGESAANRQTQQADGQMREQSAASGNHSRRRRRKHKGGNSSQSKSE